LRGDKPRLHNLQMQAAVVERTLQRLYLGPHQLRKEDLKKAREVAALLEEIARISTKGQIVDAAAGHAYVALCAVELLGIKSAIVIERDTQRASRSREVASQLTQVEVREGEVADRSLWPDRPQLVVALHACGQASDDVIDSAIAVRAKWLLLVPCCYANGDEALAEQIGIAHQAPIRRRFLQSFIDSERTLRLEAAGYDVTVSELVPPTVTPHNFVWRARFAGEPRRMQHAADQRARLLSFRER
jgi:hypothetical protein